MDKITTGHSSPRLYGIGQASVVSVRSEKSRHVVRIKHSDFGITNFIPFIQTPGLYRVPRVGDICYVFCNENFTQYPMAWGHRPSVELISELTGDREDNLMVIYSSGADNNSISHKITLDDGDESGVYIETAGNNRINIQNTNDITVTHNTGSQLKINDSVIEMTIKGNTFRMSDAGIQLISAQGSTVNIDAGIVSSSSSGAQVAITGDVDIESSGGSSIKVSGTVDIKGADNLSKVDDIIFTLHQHIGNIGFPTSPPLK